MFKNGSDIQVPFSLNVCDTEGFLVFFVGTFVCLLVLLKKKNKKKPIGQQSTHSCSPYMWCSAIQKWGGLANDSLTLLKSSVPRRGGYGYAGGPSLLMR